MPGDAERNRINSLIPDIRNERARRAEAEGRRAATAASAAAKKQKAAMEAAAYRAEVRALCLRFVRWAAATGIRPEVFRFLDYSRPHRFLFYEYGGYKTTLKRGWALGFRSYVERDDDHHEEWVSSFRLFVGADGEIIEIYSNRGNQLPVKSAREYWRRDMEERIGKFTLESIERSIAEIALDNGKRLDRNF